MFSGHGSRVALAATGATGDLFSDAEDWFDQGPGVWIRDATRPIRNAVSDFGDAVGIRDLPNQWDWEDLANSFDSFGQWVGGVAKDFGAVCAPISEFFASTVGEWIVAGVTMIPGVGSFVGGVIGAVKGLLRGGLEGMAEEALLGALPLGAGQLVKALGGLKTIGFLAQGQLDEAAIAAASSAVKTYLPGVGGTVANQCQAALGTMAKQFGAETLAGLIPDVDTGNLEGFAKMIGASVKIEIPSPEVYAQRMAAGLVQRTGAPATGPFDGMSFEAASAFRQAGGKLSDQAEGAFYTEAMSRAGDAAFVASATAQHQTMQQMMGEEQRAWAAAQAIPKGNDPVVAAGMTMRQLVAFRGAGGYLSPADQQAMYTAGQQAAAANAQAAAAAAQSKTWNEVGPTIRAAMAKANATPKGSGPVVANGWTLPQLRAYYDAGGRLTAEMRTALMQAMGAAASTRAGTDYEKAGKPTLEIAGGVPAVTRSGVSVTLQATWPPGMTLGEAIDAWELYFED